MFADPSALELPFVLVKIKKENADFDHDTGTHAAVHRIELYGLGERTLSQGRGALRHVSSPLLLLFSACMCPCGCGT